MEDGSCANPQGSLDSSNHYDMGGSDGQLVKLDPASDTLYLTFRCVGNEGRAGFGRVLVSSDIYHFYPLWVDRAGGARYAPVTVSLGSTLGEGTQLAKQLQITTTGAAQWRRAPATVGLLTFKGKLPQMKETIRLKESVRERR